jgi:cytidylate kinase
MCVVTIRGQLGSGAPEIGELIAAGIHADYVDREIIARVAAVLRTHEDDVSAREAPPGGLWGRVAGALSRGYAVGGGHGIESYASVYLPPRELAVDDARYLAGLSSVIKDLAGGGSIVIRGRGSQFILKGHPGTLHILTVASLSTRVMRVMDSLKMDEESARR